MVNFSQERLIVVNNPLVLIQAAQNQKQTNAGGLPKLLNLKIDAKIMLTTNID